MMADQPKNARLAKDKGFLVELDWNNLSEKDFEGAINEILNNPKYVIVQYNQQNGLCFSLTI